MPTDDPRPSLLARFFDTALGDSVYRWWSRNGLVVKLLTLLGTFAEAIWLTLSWLLVLIPAGLLVRWMDRNPGISLAFLYGVPVVVAIVIQLLSWVDKRKRRRR